MVVVVEADDLVRNLVACWLEDAGYAVTSLPQGAALPPLHPQPMPCLVIVDLPRPRRDHDLLQRVRAAYPCPVVVLSARFRHGLQGSAAVAARLGVDRVLPKPFSREELLAAVASVQGIAPVRKP